MARTARTTKIAALTAGGLVGLLMLAAASLLVGANTGPGRRAIEALAPRLSGGAVTIQGLAGRFPDRLRATHVELRDSDGAFARLDQVSLDWSPWRLLLGEAKIEKLVIARATLERLPAAAADHGAGPSLPWLRIADLEIGRLDLAAAVAGVPAAVRLQGHLTLASMTRGSAALQAKRFDAPGTYDADIKITPATIMAEVAVEEPGHGLVGGLAGLPNLGPLAVRAKLAGPRSAARTDIAVAAGPLRAEAHGTIDLEKRSLDIDLSGSAPAMAPRPGLAWRAAKLDAHLAGPMAQPDTAAHLLIERLTAAGGAVQKITAEIAGTGGALRLKAELSGLRVPGPRPDLFASAPVAITAEAMLQKPARPIVFSLSHPLISVRGEADTAGAVHGKIAVRLRSLAPVAALTALDLKGNAVLDATFHARGPAFRVGAQGEVSVTGGLPQAVRLLGPNAKFDLAGLVQGDALTIDRATLDGKAFRASLEGTRKGGVLDFGYRLALADLSGLAPNLTGALDTTGRITGPEGDFALTAETRGTLGAAGVAKGPVEISLRAQGLPDAPSARIKATGSVAGAPLHLQAAVSWADDGTVQLAIHRAQWKSAAADGHIVLAARGLAPTGRLRLRVARLQDFAPFLGTALGGSVDATLDTGTAKGKPELRVQAEAKQVTVDGKTIGHLTLGGRIADPLARPVLALQLGLDGIAVNEVSGRAEIAANGPLDALALRLSADVTAMRGPARLAAEATLRLARRRLDLATLSATYGGATARLLAPTALDFRDGVTLNHLGLGLDKAVLTANGRLSPALDLRLSARDLDPALARVFLPELDAEGRFALDAKLAGAWTAPDGTIEVTGHQLRFRNGPSGALPPADFKATAKLAGGTAALDATLTAGTAVRLQVKGSVPLRADGPLDLRSNGTLDLALFNALLAANGRTLQGRVTLDSRVAGTLSAPIASGSAELSDGTFRDYVQGVRITDMKGLVKAEGDTLRIVRLTGKADPGTVSVSGTLKLASGLPLDLDLAFKNAAPITTDLLTATMDADLKVQGPALERLNVAGRVHINRAEINIPDSYPKSVVTLDVREPGETAPTPRPPWVVGLDVTVEAPAQIYVRGHGLTAEMGGKLSIGATSEKPEITGGFDLRRGDFRIAGQTLTLTSGTITFFGRSLAGRLDPALAFTAQTTANNVTATLKLTGYADAPQIALSSSPSLPQGDILSQLLFGQDTAHLSPFQAAQVAQALASLTGVSGGLDPLAMVRKGLGLDRLSVGAGSTPTSIPTIEAGKYITQNVYVGAKQGKLGATQAEVQIDLTKNLKLSTTVAAGSGALATGATPENDPGSTIGLTYQFEY